MTTGWRALPVQAGEAASAFRIFSSALILLVSVLFSSFSEADTIAFGEDHAGTIISKSVDFFRGSPSATAVEDIVSPGFSGKFRPVSAPDLDVGYTSDVIWFRITAVNPFASVQERYLEVGAPRLEDIRVYVPNDEGEWSVMQGGMVVPVQDRILPSRFSAFPLKLLPGQEQTFYVRIESRNAMMLHMRLWEPQGFHVAERRIDLINGLQFGALSLFFVYALIFFIGTREIAFLYFGIMVASCLLNDVSLFQYGYQYLWPSHLDWNLRSPGVLGTPIMVGATWLLVRLLQLNEYVPVATRLAKFLASAMVVVMPCMIWLDYTFWVNVEHALGFALLLLLASVTLYAVVMGIRDAWLVLLSFSVTWMVAFLRLAQILGWLPQDFMIDYSQNWAMLLSGVMIVAVMMDKMRKLRAEREEAERQAIEVRIQSRLQIEQDVQLRTKELRMAKEVAEASSHAKSAFLAQLSHELRTPLHSILGYSGLIFNDNSNNVLRRRIEAVQSSGRHLLALIDELLDYARGEAGRLRLELQPANMGVLLESVLEESREVARNQGVTLTSQIEPSLALTANVDSVRLRQVLINLLTNACRHSQGDKVVLEARLMSAVSEGKAELWLGVRDNGIGVPPESRERIFHPFERGVSRLASSDRSSLGLGLAIARQLVDLMGGELVCESSAKGSLFYCQLPIEVAEGEVAVVRQGRPDVRHYKGKVRRILVVDDIADNRALLADVLATLGFDMALAEKGEEALSLLASEPFDLVITDQLMPDMSGWELLRQSREAGHVMPFIMLSAAMPVLPDGWSPHLVFASILMKPAEPGRLADALGFALELDWERPVIVETVSGATLSPPSPESLRHLLEAVEQGRISDIEDWVDGVHAREPEASGFADAVREAVRRLDMEKIRRLAGD